MSSNEPGDRLDSWKAIAGYLRRTERTARRWEQQEGLPVHRLPHQDRSSVYAFKSELDAWRAARSGDRAPADDTDPPPAYNRRARYTRRRLNPRLRRLRTRLLDIRFHIGSPP